MSRILIAGSDSLIMPECRLLLDAKGYTMRHCVTLHDALSQVLEDPPDLLITEKGFSGTMTG